MEYLFLTKAASKAECNRYKWVVLEDEFDVRPWYKIYIYLL